MNNNTVKVFLAMLKAFEAHLPAGTVELIEEQLTGQILAHINLDKFVGSLSPELYAALAAAVDAHRDKLGK